MGKLNFKDVEQALGKLQELDNAPLTYIAAACWVIISVVLIVHIVRELKSLSIGAISVRVLALAATCFAVFHLYMTIRDYDFTLDKEKWKQDYLLTYLESQPTEKVAIEDVRATNQGGDKTIPSIHLEKGAHTIQVLFSIVEKDQDISTKVKIKKAPDGTSHYLAYKTIEKDLSPEYTDDSYYEPVLYINQDSTLFE